MLYFQSNFIVSLWTLFWKILRWKQQNNYVMWLFLEDEIYFLICFGDFVYKYLFCNMEEYKLLKIIDISRLRSHSFVHILRQSSLLSCKLCNKLCNKPAIKRNLKQSKQNAIFRIHPRNWETFKLKSIVLRNNNPNDLNSTKTI